MFFYLLLFSQIDINRLELIAAVLCYGNRSVLLWTSAREGTTVDPELSEHLRTEGCSDI